MPPKRKAEADADTEAEPSAIKRTRTTTAASAAAASSTTAPPAKRARAGATALTKASAAKTAPKPRAPRGSKAASIVSASFTSQDDSQPAQKAQPPKPKRIRAPRAEKPWDRPKPLATTDVEKASKAGAKTTAKPAAKTIAKTTAKPTTKAAAKTTARTAAPPATNVNKEKNKDIFDLPSSSDDELQEPISTTAAGRTTRGWRPVAATKKATVTKAATKPTARRTRAVVEQEDKEKSPTGAISVVISTPRSRPVLQETAEVDNEEEEEEEQIEEQIEEQQEEDELIVESRMDADEDIVIGGRILPAKPQARTKRPSRGRPSLGTEGLVDPFDTPKARKGDEESRGPLASAAKATPIVKAITPSKQTPKSMTKPASDLTVTLEGIAALKKQVLNKVMGRQRPNLVGVDEEYRYGSTFCFDSSSSPNNR